MKKTYVTSMPDHIGAFLKASKCFSALGINVTRVSYNKAVDSHMLFIDAEGTPEQLLSADTELNKIGYLQNDSARSSVVLIEFRLRDVPGSVTSVLELINDFKFNISYISSQENGTDYQFFKMGLYVDDPGKITEFIEEAGKLCKVRLIDYNSSEKIYDNSIFYDNYVSGISKMLGLSDDIRSALLTNVNLAMQTLDEQGLSPYRTFDSISRFAELLGASRGSAFSPRISSHKVSDNTEIVLVEPPCGSNTVIILSNGKALFVDCGYSLYEKEMLNIYRRVVDGFDRIKKTVLVTHADVDHCGLLRCFDEIIASPRSAECLEMEYLGLDGYREKNPLHKPYINICKLLTSYRPIDPTGIKVPWTRVEDLRAPLTGIGILEFGDMQFEVLEGKGGHLAGEIVLIDYSHHVAITGDIYINIHAMTQAQAEYNRYAPILMTSVDTDPSLCAEERRAIFQRLGAGEWQIFGAHGAKKDYSVSI